MPYTVLFLTKYRGVTESVAGLLLCFTLAAPIVTALVQRLTRRHSSSVVAAGAAAWVGIGWLLTYAFGTMAVVSVAGVFFWNLLGTVSARLMTAYGDLADPGKRPASLARVRMVYTLGWVAGPALGGYLLATGHIKDAFLFSSAFYLLSAALIAMSRSPVSHSTKSGSRAVEQTVVRRRPVWMLSFACTLALSGDAVRLSFLPLRLTQAHVLASMVGWILATAPAAELVVLPLLAQALARVKGLRVLSISLAVGCAGFVLLALGTSPAVLILGQAFAALMISTIHGVAPAESMELGGAGSGGPAVLYGMIGLSSGLGAVTGSVLSALTSTQVALAAPAAYCVMGLILVLMLDRYKDRSLNIDLVDPDGSRVRGSSSEV